jgi:hypothetical protein
MANDFLYGAYYVQIARRDSDGYPMGVLSTPDSPVNGSVYSAYLMRNIRNFTQPQPSVEYVIDQGGQKIRAKKFLGITDFGEATIEFSERDDVFHSLITGTSVVTDYPANWRQTARNINIETPPSWFMIGSVQSQQINDITGVIEDKWFHHIFLNVQFFAQEAGASQSGGNTPNPLVYNMVVNRAFRGITGKTLEDAGFNVVGNSDTYTTIESDHPIALDTYIEAGSPDGTFTAKYLPLTNATSGDKGLTKEGTQVAISSASITTGAIAASAGSAGDRFVYIQEADLDSPTS